ncbi:MAG: aromatic ring-hydroxylating dioxygenase subunit alpha [Myxococcales bacterium]|nr:aromatic ring-hydroxylating dioxygenase subunit alpha [Myxococcales bacterium]
MLKNFWYAVHESAAIAETPVKVRLLGRDLALVRGEGGHVLALDDRCPHRGAALSDGWRAGNCLACPYHGWQFQSDGACVRIPANRPGQPVPKKARVGAYPTAERYGWVWVFVGDLAEEERPPLPPLPEYGDPDWRALHGEFLWNAHYTRVVENGMDFAHAPFVHARSFGNPDKPVVPDYEVELDAWSATASAVLEPPDPPGLWKWVRRKQRPGVRTSVSFYMPTFTRLDVDLGRFQLIVFDSNIPIDEEHTLTRWIMLRNFFKGAWADGDARRRTMQIFLEDQPIVEAQRPREVPAAMSDELHVRSDAMPLAYRKLRRDLLARGWGLDG